MKTITLKKIIAFSVGVINFFMPMAASAIVILPNADWTTIVDGNPFGLPEGSIIGIIYNVSFWLLAIFAIAGVVGFVLSGIFYLLAGADEDLAKKGKSGMSNSIIGIIVGLSGIVIMQAARMFLEGNSTTF